MKNVILFFLYFFSAQFLSAQEKSTTLSDKHVTIRGTRFAMIPPVGYRLKTNPYKGFEDLPNAARIEIVEVDVTRSDVYRLKKILSKYTTEGKTLISEEDAVVSGMNASIKKVRGMQRTAIGVGENFKEMAEFIVEQVIFTFENYDIYVIGTYKAKDEAAVGKQIDDALKSFIYQKDKQINVLEQVDFKIDPSVTTLKPYLTNSAVLGLNVSGTEDGGDEPTYSISQFDNTLENEAAFGDANETMTKRLSSYTIYDKKMQLLQNKTFKGYEVTAYDRETSEETRLIYIAIVKTEKKLYSVKGEALYNCESSCQNLEKLHRQFQNGKKNN